MLTSHKTHSSNCVNRVVVRVCVDCAVPLRKGAKRQCRPCYRARRQNLDPEKRFWSRVHRTDGCWMWTGSRFGKGYGQFTLRPVPKQRIHVGAHAYSYRLFHGPVPDGMEVMHLCHNKLCVRPDHLKAGTHLENIRASVAAGHYANHRPKPKKLSDEQVAAIVALHKDGVRQNRIAEQFGVSTTLVCQFVNGQARQRVTQREHLVESGRGSQLRRVG